MERCRRIERVADRLFEGEEAVLHVMGEQIASEKRRNPWTSARSGDLCQVWTLAIEQCCYRWTFSPFREHPTCPEG